MQEENVKEVRTMMTITEKRFRWTKVNEQFAINPETGPSNVYTQLHPITFTTA